MALLQFPPLISVLYSLVEHTTELSWRERPERHSITTCWNLPGTTGWFSDVMNVATLLSVGNAFSIILEDTACVKLGTNLSVFRVIGCG